MLKRPSTGLQESEYDDAIYQKGILDRYLSG